MSNIEKLVELYNSDKYWSYTNIFPEESWGNVSIARDFLQKYSLPDDEYDEIYCRICNIYGCEMKFDKLLINNGYKIDEVVGGYLLLEEDIELLNKLCNKYDDKYYYIIESVGYNQDMPIFRLKFPSDITWEELMSGNYISTVLFEMPYSEYFIIGQGDKWSKYADNESFPPASIYLEKMH